MEHSNFKKMFRRATFSSSTQPPPRLLYRRIRCRNPLLSLTIGASLNVAETSLMPLCPTASLVNVVLSFNPSARLSMPLPHTSIRPSGYTFSPRRLHDISRALSLVLLFNTYANNMRKYTVRGQGYSTTYSRTGIPYNIDKDTVQHRVEQDSALHEDSLRFHWVRASRYRDCPPDPCHVRPWQICYSFQVQAS